MDELSFDELQFFDGHLPALPLYVSLRARILSEIDNVEIQVKKTQISFKNPYLFGAVSFTPVRKAKDRPKTFITVTFGLFHHCESPRIDAATEPYPNRWTHHILVGEPQQIDDELMSWLKEAAALREKR